MSIFDRFIKKDVGANYERKRSELKSEYQKDLSDNVQEDIAKYPEYRKHIEAFFPVLKKALDRHIEDLQVSQDTEGGVYVVPVDASTKFYLPPDRLVAFACIFPPLDGGKVIDAGVVTDDLRYEGISFGIQEEKISDMIHRGQYLHIFPVAFGTLPKDGDDGEIKEFYERRGSVRFEIQEGEPNIFDQRSLLQVIRKGEIICRIKLPTKGSNGRDVTGHLLIGRDGITPEIPAGENTEISSDGQFLIASGDGIVVMRDAKFCVERQYIIMGDMNDPSQNIVYPGNIYIGGNVTNSAVVKASGNIFIKGEVTNGHVISTEGSIRVQGGIRGDHDATVLKAARQLQAPVIEAAYVQAGGNVYAEVIVDSNVTSDASIYVIGGRGLILGGHVRARDLIAAKKIGNLSNQINRITVGYCAGLSSQIEKTEKELEQSRITLEKLRRSVSTMKAAGDILSQEKRAILNELTEQKQLYEKQGKDLTQRLTDLKQELHTYNSGRVTCEELYPICKIQIAEKELEVRTSEVNCNIRVYTGKIVLK